MTVTQGIINIYIRRGVKYHNLLLLIVGEKQTY